LGRDSESKASEDKMPFAIASYKKAITLAQNFTEAPTS